MTKSINSKSVKYSLGVSLLEIMLVLSVAAAITIVSIDQFVETTRQNNLEIVKSSVRVLLDSLEKYYLSECNKDLALYPSDISLDELEDKLGGNQLKSIANPLAPDTQERGRSSFKTYIREMSEDLYLLIVEVDFKPVGNDVWQQYRGQLDPDYLSEAGGSKMSWTAIPGIGNQESELWMSTGNLDFQAHQLDNELELFQPAMDQDPCK